MPTPDEQRSEAVTVAWMLAVMATALADVLAGVSAVLIRWVWQAAEPGPWRNLPALMLFTALLTGLVSLGLLPLVYRFRPVPPPWPITAFAIAVAGLPWLIGLALASVG